MLGISAAALICLINSIASFWLVRHYDVGLYVNSSPETHSYIGRDHPHDLPLPKPLAPVSLTVENSVQFNLYDENINAVWTSNIPRSGAFVHLGPERRIFVVAMFHQFHCIGKLHQALAAGPNAMNRHELLHHAQHCLGYLRQAILCHPDLTLEPGDFIQTNFTRHQVGMTHVCRDWSVVYDEVEANLEEWFQATKGTDTRA